MGECPAALTGGRACPASVPPPRLPSNEPLEVEAAPDGAGPEACAMLGWGRWGSSVAETSREGPPS